MNQIPVSTSPFCGEVVPFFPDMPGKSKQNPSWHGVIEFPGLRVARIIIII